MSPRQSRHDLSGNLKAAVELAQRLEIMCRQYLLARQYGEPDRLTSEQWDEFFDRARKVSDGRYI